MRSKQSIQTGRSSSQSTYSFFRNVLVGMVFFEPMSKEQLNEHLQRSEQLHAEAVRSHERSQLAIEKSDNLISEFRPNY